MNAKEVCRWLNDTASSEDATKVLHAARQAVARLKHSTRQSVHTGVPSELRHPKTEQDFERVRTYERGYADGWKSGRGARFSGYRSLLYWDGRTAGGWYERGYNDGYVAGRRSS